MMSSNKSKDKGDRWERELAQILSDNIIGGKFKRIVGSGAIGTLVDEPGLTGDIRGVVEGIPLTFKGEAKARTGATQLSIKKEWLDKIKAEAETVLAVPFLGCKFIGARSGIRNFIVLDIENFCKLVNLYIETKHELDSILKKGLV